MTVIQIQSQYMLFCSDSCVLVFDDTVMELWVAEEGGAQVLYDTDIRLRLLSGNTDPTLISTPSIKMQNQNQQASDSRVQFYNDFCA